MTDKEIQQTKDTAIARCIRLKRAASLAGEAINQTADTFEGIARVLRSPQRYDFVFENQSWLNADPLYRLIQESEKAQQDFDAANAVAASLGEAIL